MAINFLCAILGGQNSGQILHHKFSNLRGEKKKQKNIKESGEKNIETLPLLLFHSTELGLGVLVFFFQSFGEKSVVFLVKLALSTKLLEFLTFKEFFTVESTGQITSNCGHYGMRNNIAQGIRSSQQKEHVWELFSFFHLYIIILIHITFDYMCVYVDVHGMGIS